MPRVPLKWQDGKKTAASSETIKLPKPVNIPRPPSPKTER